jgi:hypothetical protein
MAISGTPCWTPCKAGQLLKVCTLNGEFTSDSSQCVTYTGLDDDGCGAGQTHFKHSAYLWGRAKRSANQDGCCSNFFPYCLSNPAGSVTAALIFGKVTNCAGGAALAGATVTLKKSGSTIATDTTDASGDYSFDACALDLAAYPYDIEVTLATYDTGTGTADPGADPG